MAPDTYPSISRLKYHAMADQASVELPSTAGVVAVRDEAGQEEVTIDLDVGGNRLRSLPNALAGGQQPNLRTIQCRDNQITKLPGSLASAVSLRCLDASCNSLEEVDVLAMCGTLTEVSFFLFPYGQLD